MVQTQDGAFLKRVVDEDEQHRYGNKSISALGTQQHGHNVYDHNILLWLQSLHRGQDSISHAVAAHLKKLGAGISPARLLQYLEAPSTLTRLTLLSADVAAIKAQLVLEGLNKGVVTAEQVALLVRMPLGD